MRTPWQFAEQMVTLQGVHEVTSGYAGGDRATASYRQVCSGTTGHAEAVEVTYDPAKVDYRTLVDYFLRHIDFGLGSQWTPSPPDSGVHLPPEGILRRQR